MKSARWIPISAAMGIAILFFGCQRAPEAEFVPVESSVMEAVKYDQATQTLSIRFVNPPTVYEYSGVAPMVYAEFLAAESKGRFFHESIKGQYPESLVSE